MSLDPGRLAAHLEGLIAGLPAPSGLLVAFSGGLDSTVLLHALADLPDWRDLGLRAIHLNHSLQPEASEWADHCQRFCNTLGVPCEVVELGLRPAPGESVEALAREARYRALAERMRRGELLLTAHHQQDQAETLLLQLIRGSGVSGLAAMPPLAPFGPGLHARPLLDQPREALRGYATANRLTWIEDPSNADPRFDRNFLRLELLPLLRRRWPAIDRTLSRSARHCAEASRLIDHWAGDDLEHLLAGAGVGDTPRSATISVEALRHLPAPRARAALRLWVRTRALPLPDTAHLDRLLHEMGSAGEDRNPLVHWAGAEARRYQGRIYLMPPLPPLDPGWHSPWDGQTPLDLPGGMGRLRVLPGAGRIDPESWRRATIQVRLRRDGERCHPADKAQGRSLKKLLQELGVPPWERGRIPLIEADGELAAVGDLLVCSHLAAPSGAPGIGLVWKRP